MAGALFFFGVLVGMPAFVVLLVRAYAKVERDKARARLIAKDAKGPEPDVGPPT